MKRYLLLCLVVVSLSGAADDNRRADLIERIVELDPEWCGTTVQFNERGGIDAYNRLASELLNKEEDGQYPLYKRCLRTILRQPCTSGDVCRGTAVGAVCAPFVTSPWWLPAVLCTHCTPSLATKVLAVIVGESFLIPGCCMCGCSETPKKIDRYLYNVASSPSGPYEQLGSLTMQEDGGGMLEEE